MRRAFFISLLLLATGCKVEPPKPPLVETVAVLLFDNESNDINADDLMQRLVYLALKPSVYRVVDIKETNAKLEKAGVTDGGQLPVADPRKIGADMGVQALIYGSVENFGYTNIGYYTERKVSLALRMVDTHTGAVIWENSQTAATRSIALNQKDAERNFAKGLADKAADKLFKSPLEEESHLAVVKTLSTLPGFNFSGFAQDDETPSSLKRSSKGVLKDIIRNK